MSTLRTAIQTLRTLPEEVTSYSNIEGTFPEIFETGSNLIATVAGKIQLMRLETEIFPNLKLDGNKKVIGNKQTEYTELNETVTMYRQTLGSVNGQIRRAIDLCTQVPSSDVRAFLCESTQTTTRVFDYCQTILPTLQDWYTQGTLLDKRFSLIMTRDPKHYNESMGNFNTIITPSSSLLGSISSGVSSGLASVFGWVSGPAANVDREQLASYGSRLEPDAGASADVDARKAHLEAQLAALALEKKTLIGDS